MNITEFAGEDELPKELEDLSDGNEIEDDEDEDKLEDDELEDDDDDDDEDEPNAN